MKPWPTHWERGRIKWDTTMVAGATPSTDDDGFWLDGDDEHGTPFVAIADMSRRGRVSATAKSLSLDGLKSRNMPIGTPGTLLFAMYASVGEVAFLDIDATWNQALLGITPDCNKVDPRFLRYVLLDMRDDLLRDVRSNTQSNLNATQVGDIWFQRPPLGEQEAIADYLDRETQRIDELIAEQRGLIETLRERRVALISRAVRRGLVESVEMTGTDIDWLGEVPVHWEVRRLKYSMKSALPGVWGSDPRGDESDVLCVRVADFDRPRLQVREEIPTIRSVQVSDRNSRLLEPNDLLIEKSGGTAINPVGFVAMYTGPSETAVYANFIARMRPADGQVPRYWLYAHAASYATRLTARSVKQTTGIQNLDQASYFDEKFPFPPADEQRKIAEYLDDQTSRIDALIAESEDLIALSQERRAALITAAVTGQIDVRKTA